MSGTHAEPREARKAAVHLANRGPNSELCRTIIFARVTSRGWWTNCSIRSKKRTVCDSTAWLSNAASSAQRERM